MTEIPSRADFLAAALEARGRTAPYLRHTPLVSSTDLGDLAGGEVFLKLENLQVTGAFKPRGPLNLLLQLDQHERPRGVVAPTGGNHGLGLAWAAKQVGMTATIYLPRSADPDKIRRLERLGAELFFCEDYEAAHHAATAAAATDGLMYVSPYNDASVIASDGVIGLEILDDCPEPDLAIVCVGGGGLVSGIGGVLKASVPGIEVVAVEAAASPTFSRWWEAGGPGPVALGETIAEGLGGYVEPDT
ncbi:MAG: threonine ammonia-lyase, partial [Gemmatimonadales bacterium]